MNLLAVSAALFFSSNVAFAQTIDYSTLPACAQQCTALAQANAGCLTVPYLPCFCQSAYLATFYQTPDDVCAAVCTSAADNLAIQQWYLNQCQNYGTAATGAVATTNTGAVATAPSTPTPSSGTSANSISNTSESGSWWSHHYPYIIMVIVLIVGFGAIIWIGVVLKRRHMRRRNLAASVAPPVVWGPHQNQDATRGYSYPSRAGSKGKGKSKAAARYAPDMMESPVTNSGGTSGKLKTLLKR